MQFNRLLRNFSFYFSSVLFAGSLTLFIFSFFNNRCLGVGCLSMKPQGAGLAALVIECERGGILITTSDTGGRDSNGYSYDGLAISHAHLEPNIDIDRDDHPIYPKLHRNWHFINSARSFAGFGFAAANDTSRRSSNSTESLTFRGVQLLFPLPLLVFLTAIIPFREIRKHKSNKVSRFEVQQIKQENQTGGSETARN
jgi:hypothetical protein